MEVGAREERTDVGDSPVYCGSNRDDEEVAMVRLLTALLHVSDVLVAYLTEVLCRVRKAAR